MLHAERVETAAGDAVILVAGSGVSGSWAIRGEQLGRAIGATVIPHCTEFEAADLAICVKRVLHETWMALRRSGTPWVWDIVDAWPQPGGNDWGQDQAIDWLRAEIGRLQPAAMVFPTAVMLADSGFTGPSLVLPHHAWPKYRPGQLRLAVASVGYEGGDHYLGVWGKDVAAQCARRGWRFELNRDLQHADIGIALRDCRGYPARNWKSNCKLANIQALGIPAICTHEQGYAETPSGTEFYVGGHDDSELEDILDRLADYELREKIRPMMLAAVPRLEQVAARYREWLSKLSNS